MSVVGGESVKDIFECSLLLLVMKKAGTESWFLMNLQSLLIKMYNFTNA